MAQDESNSRKEYMDWLRDEVERHCNRDGIYEVYWDYRDKIAPDKIIEAWQKYEEMGYVSPEAYLDDVLDLTLDGEDDFYANCLLPDLAQASESVQECWGATQSVWDDLEEAGYFGIDTNLEQLLGQSEFRVNVLFATEAERNLDFGSIVSAFGNDYRDPYLACIEAEDLDNALSYLVNQQGYSVTELYEAMSGKESDSPLVRSVRQEVSENSSEAMSCLAALLRMDGNEMLRLMEARDKGEGCLVLPKDHATIGVFNQWSGCGGTLDIRLERDAVLPLAMVWDFNVEGCRDTNRWGSYTVDEVYGLVGSAWQQNFSYQEGVPDDVKEDYAIALEKTRNSVRGSSDCSENARPSLKATEQTSRDAAGALAEERTADAHDRDGKETHHTIPKER